MALVPFPSPQSGALQLPPDEDDDIAGAGKMSFLEHLDELRKRIVNSLHRDRASASSSASRSSTGSSTSSWRRRARALPPGVQDDLHRSRAKRSRSTSQIALIAGVVLAAPFIMYQVWMFIAPGLYANEKRLAIPFVLFTTIGFVAGAAFNHYIAFPFMMAFFASFNTPDLAFMPQLDDVFGLYTKMLLGMGVVFQMPTVVFFLAKMKHGHGAVPARATSSTPSSSSSSSPRSSRRPAT